MIDQLLQKAGLKYEDLNIAEKETLNSWLEAYQSNDLNVEKIRDFIKSMKEGVENELSKHDLNRKHDIFLKARLRNYLLLEAFLTTPERAKKQMEQAINRMVVNR